MNEQKKRLVHIDGRDVFTVKSATTPVEVKRANETFERASLLEEQERIFPCYDPDRHVIKQVSQGDRSYYVLHEKTRDSEPVTSDLPEPGFLHFDHDVTLGVHLKPVRQREMDHHLHLRSEMDDLRENVLAFFRRTDDFTRDDMDTNRGTLLYGPPGNGKTHTMLRIARACISELGAYVFMISHKRVTYSDLLEYRDLFADHPTVFLLEEITEKAKRETEKLDPV